MMMIFSPSGSETPCSPSTRDVRGEPVRDRDRERRPGDGEFPQCRGDLSLGRAQARPVRGVTRDGEVGAFAAFSPPLPPGGPRSGAARRLPSGRSHPWFPRDTLRRDLKSGRRRGASVMTTVPGRSGASNGIGPKARNGVGIPGTRAPPGRPMARRCFPRRAQAPGHQP